jgi:hypothetical protein
MFRHPLDAIRSRLSLALLAQLPAARRERLVAQLLAGLSAAERERILASSPGFVRFAQAFLHAAGRGQGSPT